MIKCIIQVSDIHIRNMMRHDEYGEQLDKFIKKCEEIVSKYDENEVRILICGDIVHQKNTISNELISFVSKFIRELQKIAFVVVYSGNHDLVVGNLDRYDTISAIFDAAEFNHSIFLDAECDYESGITYDENITWALYSIYDNYRRPDIEKAMKEHPDNIIIGLYHGTVVGSSLNNGTVMESGLSLDAFDGCKFVMAGDIHKRQVMKHKETTLVYPGSLIQQDFGETVSQHGFAVWDMVNLTYEFVDLDTDYGLYGMTINSIDDIDNDMEKFVNL